ncbi:MAG TPA: FapA family protein [Candidatus Kapabacteria bacterium]|nr:FapA family protein [Candidatus Kapabacteria bacterium]
MRTTTIDENFAGIEVLNGRYKYEGDLKIDGNVAVDVELVVDGKLIVGGDLISTENINATDSIIVFGNIIARDITTGTLLCDNDVIVENLNTDKFALGNIVANGDIKTRQMSSCYGDIVCDNLVSDTRIYCGGEIRAEKIYAPLSF